MARRKNRYTVHRVALQYVVKKNGDEVVATYNVVPGMPLYAIERAQAQAEILANVDNVSRERKKSKKGN